MSSLGLNVDRSGRHDPALIRSLGATWLRIVAMAEHDLSDYFRACHAAGIKILLVIARESGGDLALYQRRYGNLVDAVQVGNEPDLVSPSSWTMTPVELASLGRSVRAIFPRPFPLVCAGMASGVPAWMDGMDLSWCDAVAAHPYLKDAPNPSDLEDLPDADVLVHEYRRFGLPVIVSEWGWWGAEEGRATEEVRDMIGWAARTDLCEVFFYFCLDDAMVPPFGLLHEDGTTKPRGMAFREQAAQAIHSLWPEVALPEPEPEPEPAPEPPLVLPRGVDVASYQGFPHWGAVAAAGYQFGITKLTESTNYVNPTFSHNWRGMKAAGMVRGVYHFARPSANTPDAEAAYFLDRLAAHAGMLEPGDIVALDIEDERYYGGGPYGNAANWSLGWLEYVEAVLGFRPIVYTGPWYVNRPGWGPAPPKLGEYGLWLAAYQAQMPQAPAPWQAVAFWQFTSNGDVPGIVGDCDVNVFNGSADRIALYGKPGTIVEPEPQPEPSRAAVLVREIEERLQELKGLVA